jgi:predicted DCC family thiol-disulfide oxidoreductase YuxK
MTDAARPILIYDGRCPFCRRESERLVRWVGDRAARESFRDPGVIERHPGLSEEACERALQLVEPGGRISSGMEAVFRTLALKRGFIPFLWLYAVPGIRHALEAAYRLVARNRFRLPGSGVAEADRCEDGSCPTHVSR